jgi:hypothetical protein
MNVAGNAMAATVEPSDFPLFSRGLFLIQLA